MQWKPKEQWLKEHENYIEKMRDIAESIKSVIEPYVKRCEIAGSIRRGKPICRDIDLVVFMDIEQLDYLVESMRNFGIEVSKPSYTKNKKIVNLVFKYNIVGHMQDYTGNMPSAIDGQVFITFEEKYFGGLLLHRTGSKDFNVFMAIKAKKKGMKLSMYGLFDRETNRFIAGREKQIFKKLGMFYVYPKNRNIGWLKHMGWWKSDFEYQDLKSIGVI